MGRCTRHHCLGNCFYTFLQRRIMLQGLLEQLFQIHLCSWSYVKTSSVWSQQKMLGAAGASQMVGQAEQEGTPSSSTSQKGLVLQTRTGCPNASPGRKETQRLLILDDKTNFHGYAKKPSALGNGPKAHRYPQTVRIQFFMLATPEKATVILSRIHW
ncbi:uncharacterized protein M8220_007574 [Acridotheres tristis]